jgi:hypothetical protein
LAQRVSAAPNVLVAIAGVLQDEFAIACIVAVELKARLTCEQLFRKRFALDELKVRNVRSVEMQ